MLNNKVLPSMKKWDWVLELHLIPWSYCRIFLLQHIVLWILSASVHFPWELCMCHFSQVIHVCSLHTSFLNGVFLHTYLGKLWSEVDSLSILKSVGLILPLSVFVNTVLLNHSHVHSFTYCLQLSLHYNGSVE